MTHTFILKSALFFEKSALFRCFFTQNWSTTPALINNIKWIHEQNEKQGMISTHNNAKYESHYVKNPKHSED